MGKLTVLTEPDDVGCVSKITYDSDKGIAKISAVSGYCTDVKTLAKLKDTGNGYIIKFKSYSSVEQDNYVCLSYSEAAYLKQLFNVIIKD